MTDLIKQKIETALTGSTAYVQNPMGDQVHFEAIVISPEFEGMLLVKQHQLVMNALKEEFQDQVHALQLKTFTPEKWDQVKDQYIKNGS